MKNPSVGEAKLSSLLYPYWLLRTIIFWFKCKAQRSTKTSTATLMPEPVKHFIVNAYSDPGFPALTRQNRATTGIFKVIFFPHFNSLLHHIAFLAE
jgi:hypothetical protein